MHSVQCAVCMSVQVVGHEPVTQPLGHACGGSLVASSWVLTDIRVLITQKDIRIILGQIFMCVISRLILTSYFDFILVCGLLPLLLSLLLPLSLPPFLPSFLQLLLPITEPIYSQFYTEILLPNLLPICTPQSGHPSNY